MGDTASETEHHAQQVFRMDDIDGLLQSFVGIVNKGSAKFNITLNVGGLIISGEMIGGKEYLENFGALITNKADDEDSIELRKTIVETYGSGYGEDDAPLSKLIHLRDARLHHASGNTIPSNEGILWRGKLSSVDGFWLGKLGNIKDN